jgi:septum formation protein
VSAQLILASTSQARRALLAQAGLAFEALAPAVDEAKLKSIASRLKPAAMASFLAEAKAASLAKERGDTLVIGADQVLALDGEMLEKPGSPAAARAQLERLRGRTHLLETAVCCAQGSTIVWRHLGQARLTMRNFSDAFLTGYLDLAGRGALASVGAYQLEGRGIQLFEAVEGDYFTILGLPLLPLLAFLRSREAIAS